MYSILSVIIQVFAEALIWHKKFSSILNLPISKAESFLKSNFDLTLLCKPYALKLRKRSKIWSLKKTGPSHAQKSNCSDNRSIQVLWQWRNQDLNVIWTFLFKLLFAKHLNLPGNCLALKIELSLRFGKSKLCWGS